MQLSGDTALGPGYAARQHNDLVTRPHSRSVSVLSSGARQEEDISTIMMRGATDLRNAKFEIEEQVRTVVV